jgi:hypothetical protein
MKEQACSCGKPLSNAVDHNDGKLHLCSECIEKLLAKKVDTKKKH